jgi:CRP-like cAMP-binding protein
MNETYAELIPKFPLFQGLTIHGAQMLMEPGEVIEQAPGTVLFMEGDPPAFVLLVLTGSLQVYVVRDGREVLLTEAAPGTILGELAVLCGITRSACVRTIGKSAVLKWPEDRFRRLLIRNPFLSERILGQSLRTLIEKERALLETPKAEKP